MFTIKLPHLVTRLRATVTTDRKNVPSFDWSSPLELDLLAYVQPRSSSETFNPEGTRVRSSHVMFCLEQDVTAQDRIVWNGETFLVVGQPARHETPAGYHHTEADLLLVEG